MPSSREQLWQRDEGTREPGELKASKEPGVVTADGGVGGLEVRESKGMSSLKASGLGQGLRTMI